jgi:hypothetical protein
VSGKVPSLIVNDLHRRPFNPFIFWLRVEEHLNKQQYD